MSVMRDQCDARPTVTFPAARHHRPLAGTKLYCLVTGVNNLPRVALNSKEAGIQTHDLLITSPAPYRYVTEPHYKPNWDASIKIQHCTFHKWQQHINRDSSVEYPYMHYRKIYIKKTIKNKMAGIPQVKYLFTCCKVICRRTPQSFCSCFNATISSK